jgi:ComF family protein
MIEITKYGKLTLKKTNAFWQDFLSLFFPVTCASCGKSLFQNEDSICTHCHYHLPKTSFHLLNDNPVAKIFWGRVNIEAATAFFTFSKGSKVQHLIHQLKYKGQEQIGFSLGKWYGKELVKSLAYQTVDVIIPVPLHKKKLRKRGYNQSECFARGLACSMHSPVDSGVLFRSASSETQTKKSRFIRWKNVETIFYTKNEWHLRDKHILLVDDVVTTGATLEACAQVLSKIEGVKVSIATIAFASNS